MTPQLQQSLKLLAMNQVELEQVIETELAENPFLEDVGDHTTTDIIRSTPGQQPPYDFEKGVFSSYRDTGSSSYTVEFIAASEPSLEEHFMGQVQTSTFNVIEREIAAIFISELDERGYLPAEKAASHRAKEAPETKTTRERLSALHNAQVETDSFRYPALRKAADDLGVPLGWCDSVRRRLMKLDPAGCFAFDLQECLLAQLEQGKATDVEARIIRSCWHLLQKKQHAQIAKKLGLDANRVREALHVISLLDPAPGLTYAAKTKPKPPAVVPDVCVSVVGGKIAVQPRFGAKLRVAPRRDLVSARDLRQSAFAKEKMQSALWLVRALQHRQQTITQVVFKIMEHQRDWLLANGFLKPLTLRAVADSLGVHESTVSRVTRDKYVETPHGIFELKYFFTSEIAADDGSLLSSQAVKETIKSLISTESRDKPLNDSQIMQLLKKSDIHVARRTVAKYRESIGIPSAHHRRSLT